jgi:hypothetical protein
MPSTTRSRNRSVDSFKTELIADLVWRSRSQLELAVVEYTGLVQPPPPAQVARRHPGGRVRAALARTQRRERAVDDQSVAASPARTAEAITARRFPQSRAESAGNGADRSPPALRASPPAPIALDVDVHSGPQNRRQSGGPDPKEPTTLTTTSTEPI